MNLQFDRGTLVFRDPPAGFDAGQIPGALWDPRILSHRAPAFRHAEVIDYLARIGVRFSDSVRDSDGARFTGGPSDFWAPIELRPYQEAALCAWELGGRRGVVVLPTGSGKTRLALATMARTAMTSLCLVPTRVLLDQWLREIRLVYGGEVGCFGDGIREARPITVATFESGWRHMERIGDRFDLLIVDEAHHVGSGLRDEALEMSIASARLGLTATPPRETAAIGLARLVGPTVYELSIGDLAGRFLADFDVVTLHLDLSRDERVAYESRMAAFRSVHAQFRRLVPSGSWEDFARAAARTPEGRSALTALREARQLLTFTEAKRAALAQLLGRHRDVRVLVFCADNRSAYAIARAHLVMPLTCDIGRAERDQALERFRTGELLALVSARVLNEGIDVPDAEVAIIVGASLGEREHVQRVGRLLRPKAGRRALVYELVTRASMEVRQANKRRAGLAPRIAAPP